MLCVLCSNYIPGYGNNAQPVAEGICCDSCNFNVVLSMTHSDVPVGRARFQGDRTLSVLLDICQSTESFL